MRCVAEMSVGAKVA
uniref:Uncharacterized protein n=1 Tax=Anopheles albimanus TaxID=7167 RepID=A0A182FX72_ANOAL